MTCVVILPVRDKVQEKKLISAFGRLRFQCKLTFCSSCKERWHAYQSCDEFRKQLSDDEAWVKSCSYIHVDRRYYLKIQPGGICHHLIPLVLQNLLCVVGVNKTETVQTNKLPNTQLFSQTRRMQKLSLPLKASLQNRSLPGRRPFPNVLPPIISCTCFSSLRTKSIWLLTLVEKGSFVLSSCEARFKRPKSPCQILYSC